MGLFEDFHLPVVGFAFLSSTGGKHSACFIVLDSFFRELKLSELALPPEKVKSANHLPVAPQQTQS